MATAPALSVVIPTFNRREVIARSISSVLNQTYDDFEVIVVDDCSTDDTKSVVDSFEDARIRYICHESNKGGSAARNTGIVAAHGEYIAFQDSDAEWQPTKLEKQMAVFSDEANDAGVVYSAFLWVKDEEAHLVPADWPEKKDGLIFKNILARNFVDTATAIVKKECFTKAGLFDERLPRYQDWDMFIRFARLYKFRFIDEPLVISYFMNESITADQSAAIIARKLIFDKNCDDLMQNKISMAKFLFDSGTLDCKYGDFTEGRRMILRAVRARMVESDRWLAAIISLFGEKAYLSAAKFTSRI